MKNKDDTSNKSSGLKRELSDEEVKDYFTIRKDMKSSNRNGLAESSQRMLQKETLRRRSKKE